MTGKTEGRMSKGQGKLKPFINVPVGEFIKDELEYRGWNQEDLASMMETSLKTINQIIKGKQGITVQSAIKLGAVFGQSPEYWLNLYNTYNIIEAEKDSAKKSKTTELRSLYENYPVSEMKKKKWIPKTNDVEVLKRYISKFNLDKDPSQIAARTGNLPNKDQILKNTWVNVAEYCATLFKYKNYDKSKLSQLADYLPKYTIQNDGVEKVISDLNDCGVKLLILSHLPHTYLDGAVLSYKTNPIIIYTQRYDRKDNFWFTLAHEIAHILLHYNDKDLCILDDLNNLGESRIEEEADEYAKKILKNHEVINCLQSLWYNYEFKVEEKVNICSKKVGLCKSLVAGMLQYEWKSFYKNKTLNALKSKIEYLLPENISLDKILEEETAKL